MPPKKGKAMDLGRAIIKRAAQDKAKKRSAGTGFHVADLADSNNPLMSVTDMTSLESFMEHAVMADTDFKAQKAPIQFVQDNSTPYAAGKRGGRGAVEQWTGPTLKDTPSGTVRAVAIPRRPRWTDSTTAEELHKAEKTAFLDWRRRVAELELQHGGGVVAAAPGMEAEITPFEKYIEVWRQLWRVVERADVLIQIVDARNPLLFRCPDLDAYVHEVNAKKETLLVLNKADYLTEPQRCAWAEYFTGLGIRFVFFSAKTEQIRLEEQDRIQYGLTSAADGTGSEGEETDTDSTGSVRSDGDESDDAAPVAPQPPASETPGASPPAAEAEASIPETNKAAHIYTREEFIDYLTAEFGHLSKGALGTGNVMSRRKRAAQIAKERAEAIAARKEELRRRREMAERMIEVGLGAHVRFGGEDDAIALDEDDLADLNESELAELLDDVPQPLMVGMVGYPNVGKSSTINVLLGATSINHTVKRVAVAATPGKTKHFQTLVLNDDITLCDCPGLVFPSFVHSREEMVVNGVLPIDQLRDHASPMRLVCQRVPRAVFEETYGIRLPTPGPGQPANRQPTPSELLDTYCRARGFMAAVHAGPDHPRGARILLKDYVDGRILYAHPPPGGWGRPDGDGDGETTSSAAITGPSRGRVSYADNVLAPAVQHRHERPLHDGDTPSTSATQPVNGAPGDGYATGSDGEEEDAPQAADELDEAALRSFSRVVHLREPEHNGVTAAGPSAADGSGAGDGLPAEHSDGPRVRQPRVPRQRGLGKFGRKRKGERDADPYGTQSAADAANNKAFLAEVAAVSTGPAGTLARARMQSSAAAHAQNGDASSAPSYNIPSNNDDLQEAHSAAHASAVSAASASGSVAAAATAAPSKERRIVSGGTSGAVMVNDAVPAHLRGRTTMHIALLPPRQAAMAGTAATDTR